MRLRCLVWFGIVWYGLVWFAIFCYGLLCFGMVCYGLVWFDKGMGRGGGMFWNVQVYSRKFCETPKSFMVGGSDGGMLQLQCLLRSRPPESEIEIEEGGI